MREHLWIRLIRVAAKRAEQRQQYLGSGQHRGARRDVAVVQIGQGQPHPGLHGIRVTDDRFTVRLDGSCIVAAYIGDICVGDVRPFPAPVRSAGVGSAPAAAAAE